jgi:hypothetical protein
MAGKKNKTRDSNTPIKNEDEVKKNTDPRMDQDFENYANTPSKDSIINPKTKNEKEIADTDNKDGEKMTPKEKKSGKETDEQESNGSGGAFEATEKVEDQPKNKNAKTISDH